MVAEAEAEHHERHHRQMSMIEKNNAKTTQCWLRRNRGGAIIGEIVSAYVIVGIVVGAVIGTRMRRITLVHITAAFGPATVKSPYVPYVIGSYRTDVEVGGNCRDIK